MPGVEHLKALACVQIGSVIDVGANKGQFSLAVRSLFPDIEIHAFEPLESEFQIFKSVVTGPVKHYPLALGAETAEARFYITSRLDSSSLFKPGQEHKDLYGVKLSSSKDVPVARLSDVIDIRRLATPILMKLDVQGGELDVLKGAAGILPFIDTIYTEASFVTLYERQPLAGEIIAFLADHGFALRGVFNHSTAPEVGPTQADFLFVKARTDANARDRTSLRANVAVAETGSHRPSAGSDAAISSALQGLTGLIGQKPEPTIRTMPS